MSDFTEYLHYKALNVKYRHAWLQEKLADQYFADVKNEESTRQLCARVSAKLVEKLAEITDTLDISKREFIEFAIVDAIEKAESELQDTGVNDWIARMQDEASPVRAEEVTQ